MQETRKLKAENYDELLKLLNEVFSRKNNREMDFVKDLPKMWERDDEHMSRHVGIFEDGKLVSVVGIYPLPVKVCDQTLQFYTVGNIATHWDYAGRGYMSQLVDEAMKELDRLGADGSRLGGLRSRYNRYGYENAGQIYNFTFTEHNRLQFEKADSKIRFEPIEKSDAKTLAYTQKLHSAAPMAVVREKRDIYSSLTAWQNEPYIIKDGDKTVGYISLSASKSNIAELGLENEEYLLPVLCAVRKISENDVTFKGYPYEIERLRIAFKNCASFTLSAPCHFKIIKWDRVVNAFLKLKNHITPLQKGSFSLDIEGYGGLEIYSDKDGFGARRTDKKCDIAVNPLVATRMLFGFAPPVYAAASPAETAKFCPLPLTWNLQDRV